MVCQVLGYTHDLVVNDIVLGFLLMSNMIIHEYPVKLYIISFLVKMIHDNVKNFSSLKFSRYQSYILIMIFYHNKDFFDKSILNMSLVQPDNEVFLEFVNVFMPKVYALIFDRIPLRIFPECKILLQLNPLELVGDRFFHEDHTEVRMYGSKLAPYHIPLFLTPRLFSLEYIRNMFNCDELNFVSNNSTR